MTTTSTANDIKNVRLVGSWNTRKWRCMTSLGCLQPQFVTRVEQLGGIGDAQESGRAVMTKCGTQFSITGLASHRYCPICPSCASDDVFVHTIV